MEILLRGRADVNFEASGAPISVPGVQAGDALFVKCRSNTGDFSEVEGWTTRSLKTDGGTGVHQYIATRIATGDSDDDFAPLLTDGASSRMSMWAWYADDATPLQFDINAEAIEEPFDFVQTSIANLNAWPAGSFTPTSDYVAEVVFVENFSGGETATDLDGWNASKGSSTGYLWWRIVTPAAGIPSNPEVDWSGNTYGPVSHFAISAAGALPPTSSDEDVPPTSSDDDTTPDSDTDQGGASARAVWDFEVAPGFTAGALLQIVAAVLAGKTTITSLGAGQALVEFRGVDDAQVNVSAVMNGSQRTSIVYDWSDAPE